LKAKRASVIFDGVLAARPASMLLQSIEWKSGALLDAGATPALRIVGATTDLRALSDFIAALEETGDIPRLEVRRTGQRTEPEAEPEADDLQDFVLESVEGREALP
jgi:hypothetical protein